MVVTRSAVASLALCLPLLLAGCGPSDQAGSTPEPATDATAKSAAPALAPEGSTARTISYRCMSGRQATIEVDVSDLQDLAETLNRIQPCEYDSGFDRGTVTVTCDSGPSVVQLRGDEGRAVQPPASSLCL